MTTGVLESTGYIGNGPTDSDFVRTGLGPMTGNGYGQGK